MADWYIDHVNHDGSFIHRISPENLHVTWNKGEHGPHELTYEIAGSNPIDRYKIEPYAIDFQLYRNSDMILDGMVTSFEFESEAEFMSVGAKSYLHYLEKRFFPFDPLQPNLHRVGNPPRGFAYEGIAVSQTEIMQMLFSNIFAMPNSLPVTWELTDTVAEMDYSVELGDTE